MEHHVQRLLEQSPVLLAVGGLIFLFTFYQIVSALYIAFLGPLSIYPGPFIRRFTIIPHAVAIARGRQHLDLTELHKKYGLTVRYGPKHVMFAGSHQAWKDVYGFRKGGVIPKDPVFYGTTINGVHSIATTTDAANHTRQRKIFSNAFSDRALKAQEPMITTWALKLAEKLGECAESGARTDLLKYYNCTTFDVMGDLTFGESLGMLENSELTVWVKTIFEGIKGATILRAFKHLGALANYAVDEVLFKSQFVQHRMMDHWTYSAARVDRRLARKTTKPDIWSLVEEKDVSQGGLSMEEHHSNGNVFMIAGTETTATALSGTTYLLLRNPETLAKLTAEVREMAKSPDDLRLENLARLKYMHAVLQEGLRLYPPAPIDLPRQVPAGGVVIGGNYLPPGTKIGIAQYATNRYPDNFKDPDEFRPERWLGDPAYEHDNLGAVEPFSIGPRNCLGKNLAWHEMRILLATVILNFDLTLLPESNGWVETQKTYTLWEKKPLWCTLTKAKR